jgi:hypothetical protein
MDRGYAFACMVFNGGDYGEVDDDTFIQRCISKSNLGNIEDILVRARETLSQELRISRAEQATSHFISVCETSNDIFDKIIKNPDYTLSLDFLIQNNDLCPPFVDSNADVIELSLGSAGANKFNEMYENSFSLSEYTQNLLSGCRGIA